MRLLLKEFIEELFGDWYDPVLFNTGVVRFLCKARFWEREIKGFKLIRHGFLNTPGGIAHRRRL